MAYSKKDSILTDPTRAQKVGFTGGEPLQNIPDLEKIIEYCIENKKLKMHLHTNGTLITPQIAKWLKENNIETTLTVFGTTADIHEKITNTDARAGHDLCYSASNRVHIDSYGNVFPCTAASGRKEFSAGNVFLYDYSLWDLWQNSPLFQFIKKFHNQPEGECLDSEQYYSCMDGCRVQLAYKYGDFTIAKPDCDFKKEVISACARMVFCY